MLRALTPTGPYRGICCRRYSLSITIALLLALPCLAWAQGERAPGQIGGSLFDADSGRPVSGVVVRVEGTHLAATTDERGTFRIARVPEGLHTLFLAGPGFEPRRIGDIVVEPGETTPLRLSIRPATSVSDPAIISSTGQPRASNRSPGSVSVMLPEEIRRRGVHGLDRALEYLPGVNVNGRHLSLRASSGGLLRLGSRVDMLIDGVSYLSPDGADLPITAAPLGAIERIEVMRGAVTTLYGPTAIGGAMNIVTISPTHEEPRGYVDAYTGFYTEPAHSAWKWWGSDVQRFGGAHGAWMRRKGAIGMLVSGGVRRDEGYRQLDDQRGYDLFGRLDWKLEEDMELRLSSFIAGENHGGDLVWKGFDSALYAGRYERGNRQIETDNALFNAELRGGLAGFGYSARATIQGAGVDNGLATDDTLRKWARSYGYSGEIRLHSIVERNILLTYGAAGRFDIGTSNLYGDRVARSTGLHAHMEIGNGEDITATVGGRLDMLYTPDVLHERELHVSPMVGVAYHPLNSTSLRLTLGRGLRAPTLMERFATATFSGAPLRPDPELHAEQSWQGELGASHRIETEEHGFSGDIVLFVHEHFGMIEPSLTWDGAVMYRNLTRARVTGIDLTLRGSLWRDRLAMTVGLTSLVARDLRLDRPLHNRPSMLGHFSTVWTEGVVQLAADYRYVAAASVVDTVTALLMSDADRRLPLHRIDLNLRLTLDDLVGFPLLVRFSARNLLQSDATDGAGGIAPIRNLEGGVEVKF